MYPPFSAVVSKVAEDGGLGFLFGLSNFRFWRILNRSPMVEVRNHVLRSVSSVFGASCDQSPVLAIVV